MTPTQGNRRRFRGAGSRRAFTLVELVLVVAIVGIMAAIAVPRFAGAGERYRALLAADRVMRDIEHARARALSLGAQQKVAFTSATVSYTIVGMQNPDAPSKQYIVDLTATPYRCTKISVDFGGTETLTFNGYGVPSSGGTVTVQAGAYTCTVTVAAGTGVGTLGKVAAGPESGQGVVLALVN